MLMMLVIPALEARKKPDDAHGLIVIASARMLMMAKLVPAARAHSPGHRWQTAFQ